MRVRNLIKDLGNFQKELKDYTKGNILNGKSDKDAAKIFIHYETLKENL